MFQKYQVIGWFLAVIGALLSVYGLYGPGGSIAIRILYIIGHRIGWALSIGWMIYACSTGIGGKILSAFKCRFLFPNTAIVWKLNVCRQGRLLTLSIIS